MHPYPLFRAQAATGRPAIQTLLLAVASLWREEQPRLYRHVHPHGHATARLTRSFAAAIGIGGSGAPTLDEIELGARLHDLGKYLIAESILLKPGPLNRSERAAVSFHPVYGAQLLTSLPAVTDAVRLAVLYHHERWDGEGYPEGLAGRRIPIVARVVAVADVYTSLRARRAYKPTLTRQEAASEMERMAGRELDPELTRDFLRWRRASNARRLSPGEVD
jgi:HD-GYP domain-containing protein (c-di-GMP phosphodiesterase class II)